MWDACSGVGQGVSIIELRLHGPNASHVCTECTISAGRELLNCIWVMHGGGTCVHVHHAGCVVGG